MNKTAKIVIIGLSIFSIVALGLLIVIRGLMRNDFSYKTQDIIYRSKENPNITIEFQMADEGAFGYSRRIVKVTPNGSGEIVTEIDTNLIDKSEWTRVHEYVNELDLKGG